MPRTLALEYSHNNAGRGWSGSEKVEGDKVEGIGFGGREVQLGLRVRARIWKVLSLARKRTTEPP